MTQSELAAKSKVSLTTINETEGKALRDIRLSTLVALAEAMNISPVKFFGISDLDDLASADKAQLLKASELLTKLTRKIKSSSEE